MEHIFLSRRFYNKWDVWYALIALSCRKFFIIMITLGGAVIQSSPQWQQDLPVGYLIIAKSAGLSLCTYTCMYRCSHLPVLLWSLDQHY